MRLLPSAGLRRRLRRRQVLRAAEESVLAERSTDEEDTLAHARRAQKADYLREKLDEQDRTE